MSGHGPFPREALEIPWGALENKLEKMLWPQHSQEQGCRRAHGPFQPQLFLVASSWVFYLCGFISVLGGERPVSFIFGPSSEILHFTVKLVNFRAA